MRAVDLPIWVDPWTELFDAGCVVIQIDNDVAGVER